jgi:imidazoleglycerol-phosphate dehydratase
MRKAEITRDTKETRIQLELELDGRGEADINTGIGFFDHMLVLFAWHSKVNLRIRCTGDLRVDGHHTIEDIGIVLGQAMEKALGNRKGITRYGNARVPMDEALSAVDLDLSGRPYLHFQVLFNTQRTGDYDVHLTEEFFRALVNNSNMTLHINSLYGKNDHHLIEGIFKGFAHALRMAVCVDPHFSDEIPSTKGIL